MPFFSQIHLLWFALILVSLEPWKQLKIQIAKEQSVVICSHFSIFGTLETTRFHAFQYTCPLWFALILVSLEPWKQLHICILLCLYVYNLYGQTPPPFMQAVKIQATNTIQRYFKCNFIIFPCHYLNMEQKYTITCDYTSASLVKYN